MSDSYRPGLVKAAPLPLSGLGSQGAVDHPLPPALPPQPEAMLGTPVHHFSRPGGQSSKGTHRAEGVWRDQLNFRWGFLIITMVVPGSVLGRGWPNPTPTCPAFWGGSRNKSLRPRPLLCPGCNNLENHGNQETSIPLNSAILHSSLKTNQMTKIRCSTHSSQDDVLAEF